MYIYTCMCMDEDNSFILLVVFSFGIKNYVVYCTCSRIDFRFTLLKIVYTCLFFIENSKASQKVEKT